MTTNSATLLKQEFDEQLNQECNITDKGIVIGKDGSIEINPDTIRKNAELRMAKGAEIAQRNMKAMQEREQAESDYWNGLWAKAVASDFEKRKAETERHIELEIEKASAEIRARVEEKNMTAANPLRNSLLNLAKGLHK